MNAILERIKKAYHLETDAEVADFLDIKPSTLSMQKNRGRLNLKRIIEKCSDLNKNWLLDGEGAIRSINKNSKKIPIYTTLEVNGTSVNFEKSTQVGNIYTDLDNELEEHWSAGNLIGYLASKNAATPVVKENDIAIIQLTNELRNNSVALLSDFEEVIFSHVINREGEHVAKLDDEDSDSINIDKNANCQCIGNVISILRNV